MAGPVGPDEAGGVHRDGFMRGDRWRRRPWIWTGVALAVLAVGLTASVLSALALAGENSDKSAHSFTTASNQVVASLALNLQHEQDLGTGAASLVASDPSADSAQLVRWADSVNALARYPELVGMGHEVVVPESQLAAYAAAAQQDPSGPLGPGQSFDIQPPGSRSFYCFPVAQLARRAADYYPAGHDFCAGTGARSLLAARDSGQSAYTLVRQGGRTLLSVQAPIYSVTPAPSTVAERRAHFAGWLGVEILPQVVLARSLQGQAPGIGVVVRYHADGSDVSFSAGDMKGANTSQVRPLPFGWTIETFGAVTPATLLADPLALVILLVGVALTLVLVALLLVLATTRVRALRLVDAKTDELSHQALHDALTDLPNRALILDRTEQMLERSRRSNAPPAAMFLDLDDFKDINDTLGHEVGDRVLVKVGKRISASLREIDTVGRLGGDEFVVLLEGSDENGSPQRLARRILRVLRHPFEIDGVTDPIMVTASIGIATGDRPTAGDLLRDADMALYAAKGAGKDRYEVFRPELQAVIHRRYELEFDLRGALHRGEFHVAYQPLLNLDTRVLRGVEALLRWDHPTLGPVDPEVFIPILEHTGGIIEVGRWVLLQACTQMAEWQRRGHQLGVSVNLSARQLDDDAVVAHVKEALQRSGIDPHTLILEITETALMRNVELSTERLHDLKALGVWVAIDDFGTGYSSLSYLKRLPVDCLKIDRSFVDDMGRSPEADAVVRTVVQLAKDLGLQTLAEGVETEGQVHQLRLEHVDYAQGFLFDQPLDAATLDARFRQVEAERLDTVLGGWPLVGSGSAPGPT